MPPNLKTFMHRNDIPPTSPASPPSASTPRLDRVAQTKGLKLGKTDLPTASYSRQHALNTTNAANYPSSSSNNSRFSNPNARYQQNDQNGLLDSDVDSDFDATLASDLTIEPVESGNRKTFGGNDDVETHRYRLDTDPHVQAERNDAYRQLQSQQAQPPSTEARQGFPGITGRFTASHLRNQSDLAILPNLKNGLGSHDSKKRPRPEEVAYQSSNRSFLDESDGISIEAASDEDLTGQSAQNLGQEEAAFPIKLQTDEYPEIFQEPQIHSQPRPLKIKIQDTLATYPPDFTENQLRSMDYSKLSAESWESSREVPEFMLHESLEGASIEKRVDHYATARGDTAWNDQEAFYRNLSPTEWEQAGDHLLDKFNEFFQQIKKAKRDKRKILEQIEAEIEAREKKVRGKSAKIDLEFNAMQVGGEGLLRGKN